MSLLQYVADTRQVQVGPLEREGVGCPLCHPFFKENSNKSECKSSRLC